MSDSPASAHCQNEQTELTRTILKLPRQRSLLYGAQPLIMGIVNVTPDSFFEGSRKYEPQAAVEAALAMVSHGAHIIDFGAESTRPGSSEIDPKEERARLLPVIERFRAASDAVISVDTRHPEVARAAIEAGADILNDIEALAAPGMAEIAAKHHAAVVLMHMQGTPATMQIAPAYADCLEEVYTFLRAVTKGAIAAGVSAESIILDPGIGFGKLKEHNLALIRGIGRLRSLGFPVLIGLSRKRLVGELTGREIPERLAGSIGGALAAWMAGADIIRVHDVAETVDAFRVFTAIFPARPSGKEFSREVSL
ncbi:MAG: dihydropteroate synthase [Spirochaetia bacterium]|nr:dihydropteroate synthase [Spirochaetia bacterium]